VELRSTLAELPRKLLRRLRRQKKYPLEKLPALNENKDQSRNGVL
jgi:hypothetical protein